MIKFTKEDLKDVLVKNPRDVFYKDEDGKTRVVDDAAIVGLVSATSRKIFRKFKTDKRYAKNEKDRTPIGTKEDGTPILRTVYMDVGNVADLPEKVKTASTAMFGKRPSVVYHDKDGRNRNEELVVVAEKGTKAYEKAMANYQSKESKPTTKKGSKK